MSNIISFGSKKCIKCSKIKPSSEFYKGTGNRCKVCYLVQGKAYFKAHPRTVPYFQAKRNQEKYRKKFREKRNARERLLNAVKSGKIQRLPCVQCGNVKSEAHHEDYSKPFEVIWLCKQCHEATHHVAATA